MAFDSSDAAHVCYEDDGGIKLKYRKRTQEGAWSSQKTAVADTSPVLPWLAFDPNDNPCIAYVTNTGGGDGHIKYVCQEAGIWRSPEILTVSPAAHGGFAPSLAFDSSGTPHIVKGGHHGGVPQDIIYAVKIGETWEVTTDLGRGVNATIAIGPDDTPQVAWYDLDAGEVKYAKLIITGIPTVSRWGVMLMMILVLVAGTLILRRRRETAANAGGSGCTPP